jgi:beta-lactam-binding protein with PASTA domain
MKQILPLLWITPFLSFLIGYLLLSTFFSDHTIETPCVVGKPLTSAVTILSDHTLNARLLAQREDADLPDYTVVSQSPREYAKIKTQQAVFLVITRQPEKQPAPHLIGKSLDALRTTLDKAHIRPLFHHLKSNYPEGTCIAQFPSPDEPLEEGHILCYISCGNKKPIIWPNFKGKSVDTVREFLEGHQLKAEIVRDKKGETPGIISDQRPLPGSIINLSPDQRPPIQLFVG